MYCKVCGQDGPGDGISCTYCGSPFSSKEIIFQREPENTNDITDEGVMQRPAISPKALLIPVILFVMTAVCIVMFCIPGFHLSIGSIFYSATSRMEKVYCELLTDAFEKVKNDKQHSLENTMAAQCGADISMSPVFMEFLADALKVNPDEISSMSNIQIACDASRYNDLLSANYSLSFHEEDIISIEQYVDIAGNQQFLRIPQLTDQLLQINTDQDVNFSDAIKIDSDATADIDPALLEEVCIYYTKMLIAGFDNINQCTQKVTVGDLSQKHTVLQASISHQQLCYTMIAIMEDAAVNPRIREIIRRIEDHTGKVYYDGFLESLEKEILQFKKLSQQSNAYDTYTLYTYLNRHKKIAGIKLEYIQSGDLYCIFSSNTVTKGLQFATQMSFLERYSMHGIGTVGASINASLSIFDTENLICDIVVTDLAYDAGDFSGNVHIAPVDQIVENVADAMGLYRAYLNAGRFPDLCIDFMLDCQSDALNTKITCYDRNGPLMYGVFSANRNNDMSQVIQDLPNQSVLDLEAWRSTLNQDAVNALLDNFAHSSIIRDIFVNEASVD